MPADQIVAKDTGGSYEKPPEGGHSAVCADVIDLGYRYNRKFNKIEHKCAIVFQLAEKNKNGKRHEIAAQFTVSMGENANLRKFLTQWRGKSYSEDEARNGAPLHKLENQPAFINIEHKPVGDKTYANIVGVMKPPLGVPLVHVEDYTRSEHWKKQSHEEAEKIADREAPPTGASGEGAQPNDDDFEDFPSGRDDYEEVPF